MRNKYFIGFVVGLVLLIIAFCVAVLVMASIKDITFLDVIRSWFIKPVLPNPQIIATTIGLKI